MREQWIFIGLFAGYLLVDLILWRFWILLPMKMIAVFVHEVGSERLTNWSAYVSCPAVIGGQAVQAVHIRTPSCTSA